MCWPTIRVQQAVVAEVKIAARMLGRILHHDQMGKAAWLEWQPSKIEIRPDVAVDRNEGLSAEQRLRVQHAAAGFQRFRAFEGIMQSKAPAGTVAQHGLEALGQPRGIDDHVLDPDGGKFFQMPGDQGLTAHL